MISIEPLIRMMQLAADSGDTQRLERLLGHPDCLFLAQCVRDFQEGRIADAVTALLARDGYKMTEGSFSNLPIEEAGFEGVDLGVLEKARISTIGQFMRLNVDAPLLRGAGDTIRERFRQMQAKWGKRRTIKSP